MGFFSWKTSDTNRSIANVYSGRSVFVVYMITRDGKHWEEDAYEGYGIFGGKDYYELLAEINGMKTREEGISLELGTSAITNRKTIYQASGIDFFNWDNDIIHEGKSANELIDEGWIKAHISYKGVIPVKLVEELPSKRNWKVEFDRLPNPERCEYQGFFY